MTQDNFEKMIKDIMENPDQTKKLERGRTGYWSGKDQTVVIHDPNNVDLGTAFRPDDGEAYFHDLK